MELSVATNLPFTELVGLEDGVLATYLDVMYEQNERVKKEASRRGRR